MIQVNYARGIKVTKINFLRMYCNTKLILNRFFRLKNQRHNKRKIYIKRSISGFENIQFKELSLE